MLWAFEGTYAFTSFSSRDKQESFGGIGIRIEMQDGLLKVPSPIQGAPAANAGVVANDIITHVDASMRRVPLLVRRRAL
jgi:C-terminal processing protease CtpA/Prc